MPPASPQIPPSPPAGSRPRLPVTSEAFLRPMPPSPQAGGRFVRPPTPTDPYAQQPATPRPVTSDPYAQQPATPRPMTSDPYAMPPGTPRPAPASSEGMGVPPSGMPPSSLPYAARGIGRMPGPRVSSPGDAPHPFHEQMRARMPAVSDPYAVPPGTPRPTEQFHPMLQGEHHRLRGMRPMHGEPFGQPRQPTDSFPRPPYGMRHRMPEDPYAMQPGKEGITKRELMNLN